MINVTHSVDWMNLAACRGARRDLFFPGEFELADPAALIMCAICPVRNACLQYAIDNDVEFGIWGGLTEQQRRNINERRHRVRCPDCRSDNVVPSDRSEICLACGMSWMI
jgi:WhiB family transcriptional regulator, redox-sensing transcriptional regulator